MTVSINGEPREIRSPLTLPEFIESIEVPAPAILVEHNGVALRREEWTGRALQDGDRLEIVRVVAGG